MVTVNRSKANPILVPEPSHPWENIAAFNGCPVKDRKTYHMLYRALSDMEQHNGVSLQRSTIGYVRSSDGIEFSGRRQFIKPEYEWEQYGCEDPRITKYKDTFYIFYTALSTYPFTPGGIRIAVALTKNFRTIIAKHPVTIFNSKAMALFPQRINGKLTAILTVHTDIPPAKIAIAQFEKPEEMWSFDYWEEWYTTLNEHVIPLQRDPGDHIEVGAPPVKLQNGWLLIYSYIQQYHSKNKIFGIEAVILDEHDPKTIVGYVPYPLLTPEAAYEKHGIIPNIAFPSGAIVRGNVLRLYYGAADTYCAVAQCDIRTILSEIKPYPTAQNVSW